MKCPYCAYLESKVVDSRPADEGASIRRRRECLSCHKRFTTYEMMESLPLVVVKKDGSRQSFDRNKVMSGLIRACEKRPVSVNTLEELVTEIEQVLQNEMEREVSSAMIGELVMERLKKVDEVPPVQGHQYLHAGAEQAVEGPQIDTLEKSPGNRPGLFFDSSSLHPPMDRNL